MVDVRVKERVLEALAELPPELQRRVADFARALVESQPKGTPGPELLKIAGILDAASAAEMTAAIEQGCEQVDPREW